MARLEAAHKYPGTVVLWNRLEGRPRAENFDRAMKAEVRDALWMLSKQWQMGEFLGDDAGSPVLAKAHLSTTRLSAYKGREGPTEPYSGDVPLEAKVEAQPVRFRQQGHQVALDVRLSMGRRWLRQAAAVDPALKAEFVAKYPIAMPDPNSADDAHVCAHSEIWQQVAAVATRTMDGYALYEYLTSDPTHHAHDGIASADTPAKQDQLSDLALGWIGWFERLFYQPRQEENGSWDPSYLEHQFAVSVPRGGGEKVLSAEQYHHGHLDWYNLDIDPERGTLGEVVAAEGVTEGAITRTFVPTSVTFGGMPHPRYFTFEDWNTNLGFVRPDTTDLNKLLLMDFFVQYSNDWFIVPITMPVGSLSEVRGVAVTNVFGERFWIEAAGRGSDEDWQRWNLFTLAIAGKEDVPADMGIVVLPVAPKVLEGKPLEEVFFLRDEVANMVWAVESRIPAATGSGLSGKDAARETREKHQQLVGSPVAPPPPKAARYRLVNSVPENWIPFVPAHIEGQKRAIQLQRASVPRILEGDPSPPLKVEPRTSLLRQGLDQSMPEPYFVHEEEVSRAGTQVRLSYQRTRWFDGQVVTWLGFRKQQGRGEGRSGLSFDQLIPQERTDPADSE